MDGGDRARFAAYLAARGLSRSTVVTYVRAATYLRAGLEAEGTTPEEATYRDLVAYLRSADVAPRTKNCYLTATRHYLAYLMAEERRQDNPATGLVVGGERRRLPHELMSKEELDALYQSYPGETPVRQRNRAMLGLLVYQALHVHEIKRLRADEVDLEGGLVTVRASRIAAGRVLWLDGRQVLGLHAYLAEGRPALLAATGKQTERLFTSAGSGVRLQNALSVLARELRRRHGPSEAGGFRDWRQLRASRLALWLKAGHLREVQHEAGHRWVSSTERYRAGDVEALRSALDRHHPLS